MNTEQTNQATGQPPLLKGWARLIEGLKDTAYIWREEMRQVIKDEGVLIFFILVPLFYPLLYSWIYNNEVVREVPVVVVDQSHSALSRQFIRQCDASPDVKVLCQASEMDEAQSLVSRQVCKGIYLIPSDFDLRINRMEQATIGVYCDMSLMLAYKAIFQTAQAVSQQMGSQISAERAALSTSREAEIAARPLDFDEVPIFNPTGGYGTSILADVLMLIIQQTLVLGIGLSAGTAREEKRFANLMPISRHQNGMFRIVAGKGLAYLMVYAVMSSWLVLVVPKLFGFTAIGQWQHLLAIMVPYLLSCIFFGMVVSCLVRYRENVILLVVFISVPLLFLSGISWPQSNIPSVWQGISWLFPSTFGIRAYVRINEMGATLGDVLLEYHVLWLQTLVYFVLACLVYRYQIKLAQRAQA